jgi:hypothetical protein
MAKRLRRRSLSTALVAVALVGAIGAGTAYATTPATSDYGGVEGVVTGGGGKVPSAPVAVAVVAAGTARTAAIATATRIVVREGVLMSVELLFRLEK